MQADLAVQLDESKREFKKITMQKAMKEKTLKPFSADLTDPNVLKYGFVSI